MIADLNVLDGLVAVAQTLILASFFYFAFLVMRHEGLLHRSSPEPGRRAAPERTRDAIIAMWQEGPANNDLRQDPGASSYRLISST